MGSLLKPVAGDGVEDRDGEEADADRQKHQVEHDGPPRVKDAPAIAATQGAVGGRFTQGKIVRSGYRIEVGSRLAYI